jgi:hypothetical protein
MASPGPAPDGGGHVLGQCTPPGTRGSRPDAAAGYAPAATASAGAGG